MIQNGSTWLNSSATFFQSRGKMYSTDLGNIHLRTFGAVESGSDNLGAFTYVSTTWKLHDCDGEFWTNVLDLDKNHCHRSEVVTSVRVYKMIPLIVFSQVRMPFA